ncbi:siderophore ABC transporter substrate-binding protein [Citrobacter sp. JGM124]|uniref:siderophore ABC transporter substrate-binding protein n=1 Tax=Citrobacter sp. JGM124 TaxID=2799789 RepID=UPI001BA613BF|nr:siderophore ABC transporter substrate-binding protein [Citrobacter sp. JGM124]MBS0848665.1 siderophore ABC transporter substrate-binding protein [Citrobacter sp. JGM124]
MRLPLLVVSSLFAAVLTCSSPVLAASSSTIDVVHAQGTTQVPKNPQRVVILSPATLDIADALGVDVIGVPQTSSHFPAHLAKYNSDAYINAGTLFEPNYEALINAKPDLIIAGARAAAAYDKLSGIAPTISLDIDPKNFLASMTQRTEQLGEIFGKQEKAKQVIADFDHQAEEIRKVSGQAGSAMMLMVNGGKINAYSPDSRFGFIFDVLGFKPAATFPAGGQHGNTVSPEFIMESHPDWLFVLDRDNAIGNKKEGASASQVLDNPLVRRTPAWKNQHVVYLDSGALYIAGGIQSYSNLMTQVNKVLNENKQK